MTLGRRSVASRGTRRLDGQRTTMSGVSARFFRRKWTVETVLRDIAQSSCVRRRETLTGEGRRFYRVLASRYSATSISLHEFVKISVHANVLPSRDLRAAEDVWGSHGTVESANRGLVGALARVRFGQSRCVS